MKPTDDQTIGSNEAEYEMLKRRNRQLEENNRDMKQFTYAISHDLKNSLTKLKLSINLLENETIPADIAPFFQIIQRSADELERTLLSLNEIIHLEDAAHLSGKPISLPALFETVQQEFADDIRQSGASISTDFSVNEVHYIETYLKSTFTNLLSNAIKYASPDRPLKVNVTAAIKEDKILLSFADNGEGIDLAQHGDKLFAPFARISAAKEGKGLGLYIIKNMIERNGGKIQVESTLDKGTSFRLLLNPYYPK